MVNQDDRRRKVALRLAVEESESRGTKRKRTMSEDDAPFRGFSPAELQPPPARSEVHPQALRSGSPIPKRRTSSRCPMVAENEVRRSSRIRKNVNDGMFVYYK